MATKTILIDDFDGTPAIATYAFQFQGKEYQIDLSEAHVEEFEAMMSRWINSSRQIGGRRSVPKAPDVTSELKKYPSDDRPNSEREGRRKYLFKVREWANNNGHQVSAIGRVPAEIVEAYERNALNKGRSR
jgi:hypothetical protein